MMETGDNYLVGQLLDAETTIRELRADLALAKEVRDEHVDIARACNEEVERLRAELAMLKEVGLNALADGKVEDEVLADAIANQVEIARLRADNRRHKDAVLALTKRCEEARILIDDLVDWDGCPMCPEDDDGHNPDCPIGVWLKGKP